MVRETPNPRFATADTAESDERDTRIRLPTRVAGSRPSAIQRWTVRAVTPSSSPTSRGVNSSFMSLLSQFETPRPTCSFGFRITTVRGQPSVVRVSR